MSDKNVIKIQKECPLRETYKRNKDNFNCNGCPFNIIESPHEKFGNCVMN